jgi:uncharacterized protein
MGRFVAYDLRTRQILSITQDMAAALTGAGSRSRSEEEYLRAMLTPFEELGFISLSSEHGVSSHANSNRSMRATVVVAAACNHRCTYCWNSFGTFGTHTGTMSTEKAIEVTNEIFACSPEVESIEIEYFGGEPLLAWDAIKASVNRAIEITRSSQRTVRFALTTNGSLLSEEIAGDLVRWKFWVAISIDGEKAVHDLNRLRNDGQSSWEGAMLAARRLQSSGLEPMIRATVLSFEQSLLQVRDSLASHGFKRISVECADERLHGAQDFDSASFAKQMYQQYAVELVRRLRDGEPSSTLFAGCMVDELLVRLWHGRSRGCALVNDASVAYDVNGDAYPCRTFIGFGKWRLAHNEMNLELDSVIKNKDAQCRECEISLICCGGCIAVEAVGGDWTKHCDRIRSAAASAIWILCELAPLGVANVTRILSQLEVRH